MQNQKRIRDGTCVMPYLFSSILSVCHVHSECCSSKFRFMQNKIMWDCFVNRMCNIYEQISSDIIHIDVCFSLSHFRTLFKLPSVLSLCHSHTRIVRSNYYSCAMFFFLRSPPQTRYSTRFIACDRQRPKVIKRNLYCRRRIHKNIK